MRLAGAWPARVTVAVVLAASVALRFRASSPLWLDEALTANIAGLPLERLTDALRHDGAPPLYFALLHGWIRLVGDGDAAVRALSGLLSVAALPVMWLAGCRLGGRRVAWVATLLLATNPFAVRYATEARMYALLVLLGVLGYLVLARALERPDLPRLVAVAVVAGLLLLTHYWAFYLVGATAALMVAWVVTGVRRAASLRCLTAAAAGALCLVPWLPHFVYQLRHTGTPWAEPAGPTALLSTVAQYSGGPSVGGRALGLLLVGLATLGAAGRAVDGRRVELDLLGRPPGRALALVFVGSMALAVAAGVVAGTGLEARYSAAAFPLLLLLAALGTTALRPGPAAVAAVAAAVAVGLAVSLTVGTTARTQAAEVAAAIARDARPGDVVAYCPDQLGPAVHRRLPAGFRQLTFPEGHSPELVDWADYARRQAAGDSNGFAPYLHQVPGAGRTIWLVWAGGYRGLGDRCERLHAQLAGLRAPRELLFPVSDTDRTVEASHLTAFPPP